MVRTTRDRLRDNIDLWRIDGFVLDSVVFANIGDIPYMTAALAMISAGFCFEGGDPKTDRQPGWRYSNGVHESGPVSFFLSQRGLIADLEIRYKADDLYETVIAEMTRHGWTQRKNPQGSLFYVSPC
jgi:hypothetical protein